MTDGGRRGSSHSSGINSGSSNSGGHGSGNYASNGRISRGGRTDANRNSGDLRENSDGRNLHNISGNERPRRMVSKDAHDLDVRSASRVEGPAKRNPNVKRLREGSLRGESIAGKHAAPRNSRTRDKVSNPADDFEVRHSSSGRDLVRQEHYKAHGSALTNPEKHASSYERSRSHGGHGGRRRGNSGPGMTRGQQIRKRVLFVLVAVLIVVGIGFVVSRVSSLFPFDVMINGQSYQVDAGSSVQSIVDSGIVETNPGDLLAVDGSVLEEGKGEPFSFKVNGKEYDVDAPLHNGDIVELTPGRDVTEDADSTEKTSEYKVSVSGSGPMSVLMRKGVDGVKVTLVGKISGKTVTETKTKTTHALVKKFSSDTEEKVVALTFDDGPGDYTQEILDILAKYKVKATFFVDGASVEKNPDEAKAIVDGGNQIAVHAYENAYLTDMDSDEVKDSVDKTISAIKSSTGVQTDVMRAPYLAFGADEWKATDGAITYLIGATIDTHDLDGVGADQILSAATDVGPGDIIEMHAGGGDLTATVESLPKIIESLQKQGYTLVTVDELLSKSTVPTVTSSSI